MCPVCALKEKRKKRRARPMDRADCSKPIQTLVLLTGSLEQQQNWWWNMELDKKSDDAQSVQSAPPNPDLGGQTKCE